MHCSCVCCQAIWHIYLYETWFASEWQWISENSALPLCYHRSAKIKTETNSCQSHMKSYLLPCQSTACRRLSLQFPIHSLVNKSTISYKWADSNCTYGIISQQSYLQYTALTVVGLWTLLSHTPLCILGVRLKP